MSKMLYYPLSLQTVTEIREFDGDFDEEEFDEDLAKRFINTDIFCDKNIFCDKFCLMLREGVYPDAYMDSWQKFNETLLQNKAKFYSRLNMEDLMDVSYEHTKKGMERL